MIKNLPQKLKTLRLQYGFSQKKVAERIGISPSIVSGYETGERTPSLDVLISLSRLYNTSIDSLLDRQAAPSGCIIDISKLTDRQKAAIIALIDSMQ